MKKNCADLKHTSRTAWKIKFNLLYCGSKVKLAEQIYEHWWFSDFIELVYFIFNDVISKTYESLKFLWAKNQ